MTHFHFFLFFLFIYLKFVFILLTIPSSSSFHFSLPHFPPPHPHLLFSQGKASLVESAMYDRPSWSRNKPLPTVSSQGKVSPLWMVSKKPVYASMISSGPIDSTPNRSSYIMVTHIQRGLSLLSCKLHSCQFRVQELPLAQVSFLCGFPQSWSWTRFLIWPLLPIFNWTSGVQSCAWPWITTSSSVSYWM